MHIQVCSSIGTRPAEFMFMLSQSRSSIKQISITTKHELCWWGIGTSVWYIIVYYIMYTLTIVLGYHLYYLLINKQTKCVKIMH